MRTNDEQTDQVIHNVDPAASFKAVTSLPCVPKPRPPTPYDTPVQQVEFAKNKQAYFASMGPPVKASPPGIQLFGDLGTQGSCSPTET